MKLSEAARLELMKTAIKFAADNFNLNQDGIETTRTVAECYKILEEVISLDATSRKLGIIGQPSPFLFGVSKRTFAPFRFLNKGIGTLQEIICSSPLTQILQKSGQGNDSSHSFINRNGHYSSPSSDVEQHPTDSHSTGRNESLTRENAETAAHTAHSGPVAPVDKPLDDLLKTLPLDELRSLQKRIVPEALISDLCGQASEELLRRRKQK